MERLSSAVAKKFESNHKPTPLKAVPKGTAQVDDRDGAERVPGQEAAHDFDLALAALHSGDYDSAASLVEKLRRSSQDAPNSYGFAVVQLGLLVQEGRDCAQSHKTRSALRAFAKQSGPIQASETPAVDRSV
jgi:hypothetical protein